MRDIVILLTAAGRLIMWETVLILIGSILYTVAVGMHIYIL